MLWLIDFGYVFTNLRFRVKILSWIFNLDFRVRFSSRVFLLYFVQVEFACWIFEFDFCAGFLSWVYFVRFPMNFQWFYVSGFVNGVAHHLFRMEKTKFSRSLRGIILLSFYLRLETIAASLLFAFSYELFIMQGIFKKILVVLGC